MLKGLGGAGGTELPGAVGMSGFGGGGIVGGAPAAAGRGLGGRLTEPSLAFGAPGMPSLRGGRTMRTVSFFGSGDFLGSFMAEETSDIRAVGSAPLNRPDREDCSVAVGVSNHSPLERTFLPCFDLLLASEGRLGNYFRPFSFYGQDFMERARKAQKGNCREIRRTTSRAQSEGRLPCVVAIAAQCEPRPPL
jgi:hypothetical protein